MDEIREILTVIAEGAQATTSAAEAVKKAVEDKKSSGTDWSQFYWLVTVFSKAQHLWL